MAHSALSEMSMVDTVVPTHTIVFIDVDDTIAPISSSVWRRDQSGWVEWRSLKVAGMHVLIASGLVAELYMLAEISGVEIRWLTDWHDDALDLGEALGLPTFAVSGGSTEIEGFDYKAQSILRDLERSSVERFVWLDDNAPRASRNLTPEQHRALDPTLTSAERGVWSAGSERLIIGPEANVGLTPEDMAAVIDFCRRGNA